MVKPVTAAASCRSKTRHQHADEDTEGDEGNAGEWVGDEDQGHEGDEGNEGDEGTEVDADAGSEGDEGTIVAQHADGWNAAYVSQEQFKQLNQTLNQWCVKLDRDPTSIKRSVNLSFNLALTDKDIKREQTRIDREWGPAADRITSGALLCKPEAAIEKLLEYHHLGADMINIAIRAPYHEEALSAYLEQVIPAVKAATS